MQKVVVQVPMDRKLRDSAQRVAEEYGFSSLQEVIRLFATKLSKRQISVDISDAEYLSSEEDKILQKKYALFLRDKKRGGTYKARSAKEMIGQLTS
jgi:antitoxin component of RelBE/YafQ-DinJ toxin-antitoxin module